MRRAPAGTAVAGLLALPVATWWLVGDLSSSDVTSETHVEPLDYTFRRLPLSAGTERAAGIAAVAVVAASVLFLIVHACRDPWDRRWLGPIGAVAVAGLIVGFGWRTMTAGVIGANIGAGLVILFGGPVLLGLLAWAAVQTVSIRRTRSFSTQ